MRRIQISVAGIVGILALVALSTRDRARPDSARPVRSPSLVHARESGDSAVARADVTVSERSPTVDGAVRSGAAGDPGSESGFWEEVGILLEARPFLDPEAYRTSVLEKTIGFLGLDRRAGETFQAAARNAIQEIELGWRDREDSWLSLSANVGLDPEVQERAEREIQERYERRKGEALARMGALLWSDDRAVRFRTRLEDWIDAVR